MWPMGIYTSGFLAKNSKFTTGSAKVHQQIDLGLTGHGDQTAV